MEETVISTEPFETIVNAPVWPLCVMSFLMVSVFCLLLGYGIYKFSKDTKRSKIGLIFSVFFLVVAIVFTSAAGLVYYSARSWVPDAYVNMQLTHNYSGSPAYKYPLILINIDNETYIKNPHEFFISFEHKETRYIEISAGYRENNTYHPYNFIDDHNRTVIKAHYRNDNLTLEIIEPTNTTNDRFYYYTWGIHDFTLTGESSQLRFDFELYAEMGD